MTMQERIKAGKLYVDYVEGLPEKLAQGLKNMEALNATSAGNVPERRAAIQKVFGEDASVWVDAPFYFRYGSNIHMGKDCTICFDCVFMDDADIFIGDGCSFNPRVTICTARKPVSPDYRKYLYADPVHIGNNCRIGAGTVICPGVTIGDNCYIHSDSVVKEDLPANSVCSGNPCRVVREIGEKDRNFYGGDRAITAEDLEELAEIVRNDTTRIGDTTQWKFGQLPESHQAAPKKHTFFDGVDLADNKGKNKNKIKSFGGMIVSSSPYQEDSEWGR